MFYLYIVRVKDRDNLKDYLVDNGVEARIHFAPAVHMMENFPHLPYKKTDFPVSEKLAETVLTLPMNQYMTDKEVREVAGLIRSYYE